MKRTLFLLLVLAAPAVTPVAAQDEAFPRYTFLGQVRHRFEINATDFNVRGAYGDFQLIENYTTQAFVIWQRANPSSALDRFTLGLNLTGTTANFRPEIDLAYQGGERESLDVSAMLVAVNLGYTVSGVALQPTVSAGIDYLSGDDDPADDTFKVFDTLYATNHKFYGFMDYFLDIPVHTLGLGLRDIHARIALKPHNNLSLRLAYHHFSANEDFALAGGATTTRFGDEVDITLIFNYNQRVSFTGGLRCLRRAISSKKPEAAT